MIDSLQQAFIVETTEILTELEMSLMELENAPADSELIAKVFRALHTIKGSASMFGFEDIAMFTHDIETAFDLIRNGKIKVEKRIIDLTLLARDEISNMLQNKDNHTKINDEKSRNIIEAFRQIVSSFNNIVKKEDLSPKANVSGVVNNSNNALQLYNIKIVPGIDLFLSGTNPLLLIDELRGMGDLAVSTHIEKIPVFEDLNPEECYCYWDILLRTSSTIDNLYDVFIFVAENCQLSIENISDEIKNFTELDLEKLQLEIAVNENYHSQDLLSIIRELNESFLSEILTETPAAAGQIRQTSVEHTDADTQSSIRVSTEKLDELVNLVSELVTIQARLGQIASQSDNTAIVSIYEEVERITWSLRDSALNIRMLPIGSTFSKFKRLVRTLSNELGKEVELTTEGAETELDKTVLEKLSDPLIHIIRNSLDHGIENPDVREKNNKPRMGTIQLSASQSGGHVLIKISDDGAGIDKEIIKAKAIENKILPENSNASESEIYSMIFAPGFSTAKKITSVSGRGVGMDVVKRAIDALRGSVEISSTLNKGTTISLKLPLTLAIIDGLLIKIAEETYVIPLSSVEECIELLQSDIDKVNGRHIVNIRGNIVPYINLRDRFNIRGTVPKIRQVVIAGINGHRIGFMVDKVIGQHQTVLKALGKANKDVEGISGATILGDGKVALIIDIAKLAEKEAYEESLIVSRSGNKIYNNIYN